MASARNSNPKWVDPDADWLEEDEGPTIFGMTKAEQNVDRFHNHEEMSPEAMAKAIHRLQTTVEALESRLMVAEEGSAGAVAAARDLGVSMVQMGDAMTRRVKALEDAAAEAAAAPEPTPLASLSARPAGREKRVVLVVGMVGLLIVAVGAVALMRPQSGARGAAPSPALYAPSTN